MTTLLAVLILLNLATLIAGWRLYRRTARLSEASSETRERRQQARWLREIEAKERWTTIDLDELHPVNREEVAGLLGRIEGASARALTAAERALLDRMVEAQRRAAGRS